MIKARNLILNLSLHCLNFTLNYITLKIWRKKQMWNPYQTKKITMHAWIYLNYGLRISVEWLISNVLHVYNNKRQDDSQYNCPPPQSAASRTDVTITHKRMALDLVMMPMSKGNEAFCAPVSLTCAPMQMKKPGKLYKNSFNLDGSPKYGNEREVNGKERMQFWWKGNASWN